MSSIFLFQPKHYHLQTLSLSTLQLQLEARSHIWHFILATNIAVSLMHLSLKLNLRLAQPFLQILSVKSLLGGHPKSEQKERHA